MGIERLLSETSYNQGRRQTLEDSDRAMAATYHDIKQRFSSQYIVYSFIAAESPLAISSFIINVYPCYSFTVVKGRVSR